MSNLDENYYQTKNSFFHSFVSFTVKSIIGMAIFLAIMAIVFT